MKRLFLVSLLFILANCNTTPLSQDIASTPTPSPTKTLLPTLTPSNTVMPSQTPTSTSQPTATTVSGVTAGYSSLDWTGRYYPNTTLTEPFGHERIDDEIEFDWGESSPAPNIPEDNFSVFWIRCINFRPRMYTFTANTNENTRLVVFVNNIFALESGFGESGEVSIDFLGPAGNHCITLELTHETGPAYVFFSFE